MNSKQQLCITAFPSLTPITAACISILGIVTLSNGVTLVLAALNREQNLPVPSCHRIYATAHIASGAPSLKMINSGNPIEFISRIHSLKRTSSAVFNNCSRLTHVFLFSRGILSSHPKFRVFLYRSLNSILSLTVRGANKPSGS